jgi:SAM-dependent methyltransferase
MAKNFDKVLVRLHGIHNCNRREAMRGIKLLDFRSYRRMHLDSDLEGAHEYMKNTVLDVGGGRKRGWFKRPDDAQWIILDINRELSPSIMADAQKLPVKSETIDCVKCTELLEHVEYPEIVIKEIIRVLKDGGTLILSMPFNFGIHGDPYDFQRFTDYKLNRMLGNGFEIKTIKKQGLYFTVLCYMIKQNIMNIKSRLRWLLYWTFPLMDLSVKLDRTNFVKNSKFMSSFTTGFFVIAIKKDGDI